MSTPKKRVGAAFVIGTVLATVAVPAVHPHTFAWAAELPAVHINEVIQNNDAIADAIELVNLGTETVDLSGWVVADDKNQMVLDPGTVLAPGQYLMITTDDDARADKFGLGKADEVSIRLPDATTIVDRYAWLEHVSTSYAVCPDIAGSFRVSVAATPGAANSCEAAALGNVVLNEIESSGASTGSDWVELHNKSVWDVDLSELVLTANTPQRSYVLPTGTTIAAGEYLVLPQSSFMFDLESSDLVQLTAGDVAVDAYEWNAHALHTFGRCPSGVGAFGETTQPTPGAPNICPAVEAPNIVVNEVETSGGHPGDWIELKNLSAAAVDLSDWVVRDNDDAHVSVIAAGSTIEAGGYFVVEEAQLGFGLGKADSARLYLPGGHTLVDSYTWGATEGDEHAPTTFGRCADGTGEWKITTAPTKGAANDCSAPVRINEIESKDDAGGADWVELINVGFAPVDVSGMTLTDSSDNGAITLPTGTSIAAGNHLVIETEPTFGLGGTDSVTLRDAAGTQLDTVSWTGHASPTLGRCADGTGAFTNTREATPGAQNVCADDLALAAWPGAAGTTPVDAANTFGADMSGVAYAADGSVWAVNNGRGTLHRLEFVDGQLVESAGWEGGRKLLYPDGTGNVDAEGVALIGGNPGNGVLVSSERDTGGTDRSSRPSVLRYDTEARTPRALNTPLVATHEWNLAADYPGIGANAGLEGVAWMPDVTLVAGGLIDQLTGSPYNPENYPDHLGGVVFVGVEASSVVAGYVLGTDGSMARITEFETAFPGVMELEWDAASEQLWALCDDACEGRTQVFALGSDEQQGAFHAGAIHERPAGTENIANEGFAFAPADSCAAGQRQVLWADDAQTGGHAFRVGSIDCAREVPLPGDAGTQNGGDAPTVKPGTGTEPATALNVDALDENAGSVAAATLSNTGGSTVSAGFIVAAIALAATGVTVLRVRRSKYSVASSR